MNTIRMIKFLLVLFGWIIGTSESFGQFAWSGKIHYERKTNMQKLENEYTDDWEKRRNQEKKYVIDTFILSFNEDLSVFAPANPPPVSWNENRTIKNTVYCNHQTKERMTRIDVFGQSVYIRDTINKIPWKITENTRNLAGYSCQMAFYKKDSTTTVYAWYTQELIPPIGPETFSGLPGVILGLATEDGGIVYFAKSVEIQEIKSENLHYELKKNKVYTKEKIKEEILRLMGNNAFTRGRINAYLMWY